MIHYKYFRISDKQCSDATRFKYVTSQSKILVGVGKKRLPRYSWGSMGSVWEEKLERKKITIFYDLTIFKIFTDFVQITLNFVYFFFRFFVQYYTRFILVFNIIICFSWNYLKIICVQVIFILISTVHHNIHLCVQFLHGSRKKNRKDPFILC